MEKKDLIIGAFNNYDFEVLKPWIFSIKESGFTGEVVLIYVDPDPNVTEKLVEQEISVLEVKNPQKMMIHMLRFLHVYDFLKHNHANYRYVITTDVRDVIFQKNPSEWLEKNNIETLVAQSEAIKIKDEAWNRDNIIKNFGQYFYEDIKENEVYNVGILAGKSEYVKDLCFSLFQLSLNRPDWVSDQAAFNVMLSFKPWADLVKKVKLKDAWAANLHVTNKPDQMHQFGPYLLEERPTLESGKIKNGSQEEFTIIHQYDRIPSWMEYFCKKYNANINKNSNLGTAPKYFVYKT